MVKNLPASAGDVGDSSLIPGSGRSPGGRHSTPLQYSCLGNPWTEAPGGLQSVRLQRVGHNGSHLAQSTEFSVPGKVPQGKQPLN